MIIKPLLASEAPADIKFPVFASSKLDGIRAIATTEGPQSRSGKLIPNLHVQAMFKKHPEICGLDGELIVGPANAKDVFRVTTSAVMSHKGEPDFRYYVFDHVGIGTKPFVERYYKLCEMSFNHQLPSWVVLVYQYEIRNNIDLNAIEEHMLEEGYEGLIIRSMTAPYKHGRSSAKEGILLKVRRFKDSEAVIVGFTEEMENQNEATKDAFGRTERSSHKDNKVGKDALGAFVVKDGEMEFQVGTGYTRDDREKFWANRDDLVGKIIKYRYFEVGVKLLPRFPTFQGFRDKIDMS